MQSPDQQEKILQALHDGIWVSNQILPNFLHALKSKALQMGLTVSRDSPLYLTPLIYRCFPAEFQPQWSELLDTHPHQSLLRLAGLPDHVREGLLKRMQAGETEQDPTILIALSRHLEQALNHLKDTDPVTWSEVKELIRNFAAVSQASFRTGSSPHFFGLVAVSPLFLTFSIPEAALALVHESAHQELFLINLTDRLIVGDYDYALAHSPFQGMDRPPIGRIHSAHALYRMLRSTNLLGLDDAIYRAKFEETIKTLAPQILTPFGSEIVSKAYQKLKVAQ